MNPDWQHTLQQLLDADAELVVADPAGETTFVAPLARAWRLDADDADCLWLRPLSAPVTGEDGTTVFALNQCPRRALQLAGVHTDGGELVMALRSGQRARIRPATGAAADILAAWDTFVGARLDAAEELALDALDEDSWTGRYA
ncbi:hypothetical protein [Krasilnikovia sp. MM14-A1259]|uniref:hypothetical protein n=1 Tax=Krasilnikovia sp. MM14-A1259 TaxID=3373539 RepID=UPI00381A9F88